MLGVQMLCALRNLGRKKLRTLLTMSGIAIGVASVTIIGAIGQSGKAAFGKQLEGLGMGGLNIRPVNSSTVLQRIAAGKEVWCYVNHAPARPYANFFLDFAAIEHRILFWQAWALGVKGMHYWGVNYAEPNQDQWKSTLDIRPVNGDGLLVYPGADGPVNSIRWECVRDGLEDYDYLAVFQVCRRKLAEKGGQEALIARADKAGDLGKVVPDLVSFSRDPKALLDKRIEIGALIEDMGKVIGKQ